MLSETGTAPARSGLQDLKRWVARVADGSGLNPKP